MSEPAVASPVWRSILYVPANVPRFIEAAHRRGADAVQLDLEDSVPPSEKAGARAALPASIRQLAAAGADVLVRINRPLSLAVRDVEAAVCPQLRAITITKAESASHIRLLDELVTECEAREGMVPGSVRFILLIESAAAFADMRAIAGASPRVLAMGLGGEDFALDCGFEADDDTLLLPRQQMVLAARAAGVAPLGYLGSIVRLDDPDAFRAMVRRSRRFGFELATCIHPSQVTIVNDEYGVRADELAGALRIAEADAQHAAAGQGAFRLDGRMVDKPIVERARRVIARAASFEQRLRRAASGP